MADRPISFSTPMVRAILREIEQPGTGKTQTRRVLTAACDEPPAFVAAGVVKALDENEKPYRWPRAHAVGDHLYAREPHYLTDDGDYERAVFAADAEAVREHLAKVKRLEDTHANVDWSRHKRLRPPRWMPRWASRITLIVTDVRVQRLQQISNEDCIAEGIPTHPNEHAPRTGPVQDDFARRSDLISHYGAEFRQLWDGINTARGFGWVANPWVAIYTFRPIPGNIDQIDVPEAPAP